MKYKRFEETPIWQEAREFVNSVYSLLASSKTLKNDLKKEF